MTPTLSLIFLWIFSIHYIVFCTNIIKYDCNPSQDCVIDCITLHSQTGCKNYNISAEHASSLSISCSSTNQWEGGCQFSNIYCPNGPNSICNIDCQDYFSCYYTNIYASDSNSKLNLTCQDQQGSCYYTNLFLNHSEQANISCYGSALLSTSDKKKACDHLYIYGYNNTDYIYLNCDGDYSCNYIYLYATNGNEINVTARGDMALGWSHIYTEKVNDSLNLYCKSEENEYGCYAVYLYVAPYKSIGDPSTFIKCDGWGCYHYLYFYAINGALDLDINLNGCRECNDPSSCIDRWYFHCNTNYASSSFLYGDGCDLNSMCNCDHAFNLMNSNFINDLSQCQLFETDYVCVKDENCIIDCIQLYGNDGCYDKVIDATNSSSLTIICNSDTSSLFGGCESSHIYCPIATDSKCNIFCQETDACYHTEISVYNNAMTDSLNITCKSQDSCQDTDIYILNNDTTSINLHCFESEACDSLFIYGNRSRNVYIHCEGDSDASSYAACNSINIFATHVNNDVILSCIGDYACYKVYLYATNAGNILIDALGKSSTYYNKIHGEHANKMTLNCRSGYGQYGCYHADFYIAENATTVNCQGYGCYYMYFYAQNGAKSITNISFDGCDECHSLDNCIQTWYLNCGPAPYVPHEYFYGTQCKKHNGCNCNDLLSLTSNAWKDTTGGLQCDIFEPEHACADGTDCTVNCTTSDCSSQTIFGGKAKSLTVLCWRNNCKATSIYCSDLGQSECTIQCNDEYACSRLNLYGDMGNNIINVSCSQSLSCYYMSIYVENADAINFQCNDPHSCQRNTIFGDNADEINMYCLGNGTSATYAACYSNYIHGNDVTQVRLVCHGHYSCYNPNLYTNNAQLILIEADGGDYSLYSGIINASNASKLEISCTSHTKSGCYYTHIYYPSNSRTSLNCKGTGCYSLYLYSNDNDEFGITDIKFNGCGVCDSIDDCIYSWYVYCGADYEKSESFNGGSCTSTNGDHCQCDDLMAELEEAWIHSLESTLNDNDCNDGTLNFTADFKCEPGTNCQIICNSTFNCSDKIIYGDFASSLTVDCIEENACSGTFIYCPEGINHSECNIECLGISSCQDSNVFADTKSVLTLDCDASDSCLSMIIFAYDSYKVNIQCTSEHSCSSMKLYSSRSQNVNILCQADAASYTYSTCYQMEAFVTNVNQTITLDCNGKYSCYGLKLHANDANNVDIFGQGFYGMYANYIYATNANHLNINCIGIKSYYGCLHNYIYIPHTRTTLNCLGYGCSAVTIYSINGAKDLDTVNMNGCGICNSFDDCITQWSFQCESGYFTRGVFYGSTCDSSNCNCYSMKSIANTAYINDSTQSQCTGIATTPKPTIYIPLTVQPTLNPTLNPTLKPIFSYITTTAISTTNPVTISPTDAIRTETSSSFIINATSTNDDKSEKSSSNESSKIIWIAIIAGIIIVIIIIINIICCIKCKKTHIAHERLEEEGNGGEDEGIAQIALERMNYPHVESITALDGTNNNVTGSTNKTSYVELDDDEDEELYGSGDGDRGRDGDSLRTSMTGSILSQ